jgi:hypothetical protein
MIVCMFEHVQWRWALNDRLALGERDPWRGLSARRRVWHTGHRLSFVKID